MKTTERLAPGEPWGPWATLGFGLIIGMGFFLAQSVVVVTFMVIEHAAQPGFGLLEIGEQLEFDGQVLSLATCASAVVCIGLVLLFVKLRKQTTLRRYLALFPLSIKTILALVVFSGLVMGLQEVLTSLYRKETLPEFMIETYSNMGSAPLFWFAIVIAGPLFEEIYFRGFLFEGLRHTRFGATGAILFTSVVWAVIHMQYPGWELMIIFGLGIIYGVVRLVTGSLWSSILMHVLQNLVATIQTAFYVQNMGS